MDAQTKVSRGVTQLAFNKATCFYGSILLSVGVRRDDSIETMCTDGTAVWWCGDFVDSISPDEVKAVLLHEAMHIVFKHMLRLEKRNLTVWNYATDYVINPMVVDYKLPLPEGALLSERFRDMSGEQAYDIIIDEAIKVPVSWGTFTVPKKENMTEKQIEAEIDRKIMASAAAAQSRGHLPNEIKALITQMQRADVDLYDVLKRRIGGDQPEDMSFARPNRKVYWQTGIIAPTPKKESVGDIVVAIDSSGSVSANALSKFLFILNQLADDLKPSSLTVITCDMQVKTVTRFEHGEEVKDIKIGGRGGTRCMPVFDLIESENMPVDHMIYLTDMEIGDYPKHFDHPLIWVSCSKSAKPAPIGETTFIN